MADEISNILTNSTDHHDLTPEIHFMNNKIKNNREQNLKNIISHNELAKRLETEMERFEADRNQNRKIWLSGPRNGRKPTKRQETDAAKN